MSDDKDNALLACLGLVAGIPLLLVASAVAEGFVLVALWGWFVAPLGLPALTLPVAIGLSTIAGLVTHQTPGPSTCKDERTVAIMGHTISAAFVRPGMHLLVGYVAHLFLTVTP